MAYEKTGTGGFNIRKWILPIGIGALVLWGISAYNGLVGLDEDTDTAWEQVENVYQRKYDLIPNLVSVAKEYADFERETLEAVTKARASAMNAMANVGEGGDVSQFQQADRQVGVAMGRFFGYTERYPDLKANQNFLELQRELVGSENRISTERKKFNEVVNAYNKKRRRFPATLVASIAGFEEKDGFEANEEAKANDLDVRERFNDEN